MTREPNVAWFGAVLAAVAVLAAGCGGKKEERPNLSLACETTHCICTEAKESVWRKGTEVPVLWRTTGEAYCPEGYVLRLAEKK